MLDTFLAGKKFLNPLHFNWVCCIIWIKWENIQVSTTVFRILPAKNKEKKEQYKFYFCCQIGNKMTNLK